MLTITFTADEAVINKLDFIGKLQQRSREMLLADAIAAYVESQGVSAPPEPQNVSYMDVLKRLHAQIPPEEIENLPTDMAQNYKHYLYGHPKES